jgi:hypothetical protein
VPRDQYRLVPIDHLLGRLADAFKGNFDASASIAPIRALLDQGYDLEADIVPTVARTMPDLPRPLKRWDGPVAAAMIRGYRLSIRGIVASPGTVRTIDNQGKRTIDKRHSSVRRRPREPPICRLAIDKWQAIRARRMRLKPRGIPPLERARQVGHGPGHGRQHVRFEVAALLEEGADRCDVGPLIENAEPPERHRR